MNALMKTLRAFASLIVWSVAFLMVWMVWCLFEEEWWTFFVYVGVGAAAAILTIKMWPTKLHGRTPAGLDQSGLTVARRNRLTSEVTTMKTQQAYRANFLSDRSDLRSQK